MAKTRAEIQRDYEKRTGYAAQKKYAAKNIKKIVVDVYASTDADLLAKLESVPNKSRYIKDLIRADIKKEQCQASDEYDALTKLLNEKD